MSLEIPLGGVFLQEAMDDLRAFASVGETTDCLVVVIPDEADCWKSSNGIEDSLTSDRVSSVTDGLRKRRLCLEVTVEEAACMLLNVDVK